MIVLVHIPNYEHEDGTESPNTIQYENVLSIHKIVGNYVLEMLTIDNKIKTVVYNSEEVYITVIWT